MENDEAASTSGYLKWASGNDSDPGSGSASGSGSLSATILGYAQSEYSLDTTEGPNLAHVNRGESENDENATDEEVEICITRLSFYPDHEKRLYMDCPLSLPATGGRVQMRGGAETEMSDDLSRPSSPEVRYEKLRNSAAEQQRHFRLLKLAFACPLSNCPAVVTAGNLLSHCLNAHPEIITLELKPRQSQSLMLIGKSLPGARGKSNCVGLLLFESPRRVAVNSNLPKIYAEYEGRPSVLIMLWKTSWDTVPKSPLVTHLYILWLLCPQAQPALMVNVKVQGGEERKQLVHTCPSPQILEQCDLLSESRLFMRFTHREMKELTMDYTQDIELQFAIQDDEEKAEKSKNPGKDENPDQQKPTMEAVKKQLEVELLAAFEKQKKSLDQQNFGKEK